jgi:hypothetical protein
VGGPARIGVTIRQAGGEVACGDLGAVGPAGLTVELDVPPGLTLDRAALAAQAPGDAETLPLQGATLATSDGKSALGRDVGWLSLDWGARRPLASVTVRSGADQNLRGRLKVAEGGPWFPPLPIDRCALNGETRLPGVAATRLLIEVVNGDTPTTAKIEDVLLRVAARPPDLEAAVDPEPSFFRHPVLLGANEELVLRDDLTGALRRAWPAAGGKVTVTLRSTAEARLRVTRLTLHTRAVQRAFHPGAPAVTLAVAPGGSALARADVPEGPLAAMAFTVRARARRETVPLRPTPRVDPLVAHHAGAGFEAAQAFAARDPAALLAGIDLFLRALTPAVRATVSIHPDASGRPADAPFPRALAELVLAEPGSAPFAPRWTEVTLPAAAAVADRVFWAVLRVAEGEALWPLGKVPDADPAAPAAPRGALWRARGDTAWRERAAPPSYVALIDPPWAYARPRFQCDAPAPAPQITLRWGKTELSAPVGPGGRVALDAAALRALSRPAQGDQLLGVWVSAAVAAEITLSDLTIEVPGEQETRPPAGS